MRKIILLLVVIFSFTSCENNSSSDEIDESIETNSVALLKVDYLTNIFEGGKILEFENNANFNISTTYQPAIDFGSVQLFYQELDEMIFDGTIIHIGWGERSYPETMDPINDFTTINVNVPIPNSDMFKNVNYGEGDGYYPDNIDYENLWNSISNLELVENYLDSNTDGLINLFLYTPTLGNDDLSNWKWYIILKN